MKCSLNVFPFKASTDHSGVPSVPSHCWLQAFLCRLQSNRSKLPRKNSFVLPSGMFHLLVHLSAMGPGSHSSPRRSPAPDTRRAACRAPSRRGGTVTAGGSARSGSAPHRTAPHRAAQPWVGRGTRARSSDPLVMPGATLCVEQQP